MDYDADDYKDLRDGLRIDRNSLDEECITQPHSFFHACEGFVLSSALRDKRKYDLEVVVADLDKDVREAMAAEGERITEALVKAQIFREQDHHRAQINYLSACREAERWEALKNAYRQRADMLRSLVQLHQSGYFGEITGASERRDARTRFDEKRGR